jgi:NAD(P)H-dependent FMN reductase
LKNTLDYAREAWYDKAVGIVSYGSVGGARAAEHLCSILSGLSVPHVLIHLALSLFTDLKLCIKHEFNLNKTVRSASERTVLCLKKKIGCPFFQLSNS